MAYPFRIDSDPVLVAIAADLDISDSLYEDAVATYTEVGEWLAADDSELAPYAPEIYPQGSFRVGTVVRPLRGVGEYDIDIVCRVHLQKESISQGDLKAMVGRRLRAKEEYAKILTASRRCWVLTFSERFHLDVLPSIPNLERPPTGIWLTDKELRYWQRSNPKGFAAWFFGQMSTLQEAILKASVEGVPEWRVRTPLQRACQLLKRHRDIHFSEQPDLQPISIIITTLAGRAYEGETSVAAAVAGVLGRMCSHVEKVERRWRIANPGDPGENFADKWNEHPERADAFFAWHAAALEDFRSIIDAGTLAEQRLAIGKSLRPSERMLKGIDAGRLPQVAELYEAAPPPPPANDTHQQRIPWTTDLRYKARVTGGVHRRRDGSKELWPLSGRAVSKKMELFFQVETNTPRPYDVRWQVVNTGREAEEAEQLRGGFEHAMTASGGRWESTAYAGTHWVRALILKGDRCVAISDKVPVRVRG